MSAPALRLLAFDFGERRIGVAVGETLAGSARALSIVTRRDGRPDWPTIERLVEDWEPDRLLVGLPAYRDGAAHPLEAAVARFARQLSGRFGLAVETVDERLSSREAAGRLQSGAGLDAVAAEVILETWMNDYLTGGGRT